MNSSANRHPDPCRVDHAGGTPGTSQPCRVTRNTMVTGGEHRRRPLMSASRFGAEPEYQDDLRFDAVRSMNPPTLGSECGHTSTWGRGRCLRIPKGAEPNGSYGPGVKVRKSQDCIRIGRGPRVNSALLAIATFIKGVHHALIRRLAQQDQSTVVAPNEKRNAVNNLVVVVGRVMSGAPDFFKVRVDGNN